MKTKLLLMLLLISGFALAQVPTSGLLAEYEFTNGSLADPLNGDDFTKTGTMSSTVTDRFGSPNDALFLNQDYLTRPSVNYGFGVSYSFWVKTSTIDSGLRTITDDLSTSAFNTGVKIYLEDGKIGIRGVHAQSPTGQPIGVHGFYFLSAKIVADGEWHHIAGTLKEVNNTIEVDIYVDTIAESFIDVGGSHAGNGVSVPKSNENLTIANDLPNSLPNTERYLDVIDDMYLYNRQITAAEVKLIAEDNGYCFPPQISAVTISNITETTLDVAFAYPGTYDVATVKKGEPFANATVVNVVDSGSANTISNLVSSTIYDVYFRTQCSTSLNSNWSESTETRTKGTMFVNPLATGANNGTSWTDAYTDLQNALSFQEDGQEYWLASGRYIPDVSNKYLPFHISSDNVKIYGGFNGTETQLSQRDFVVNATILSGDLNDDDTAVSFSATSRSDNSNNVITIAANNIVLDGVTISDGHASAGVLDGAGLKKTANDGFKTGLKIENCVFKNNVAYNGGAGIRAEFKKANATDSFEIINSKFDNNLSRYGASMYVNTGGSINTLNFKVLNSVFSNNLCTDRGSTLGHVGSAGWIRPIGSSILNASFINNTYSNNKDDGTSNGFTNANRGTLAISEATGGIMNASLHNCIFWENKIRGTNTVAKALSGWTTGLPNLLNVTHSVDENDFSNVDSANKTHIIALDPQFVDSPNGDYTLQSPSLAVDSGDNSKVPVTLISDLNGNARIFNSMVDIGAYESPFVSTQKILNVITDGPGTTNAVNGVFSIGSTFSITATPNSGEIFTGWTGDVTTTDNPISVTLNTNKFITAKFEKLTFVNQSATGNNDGTSWANAYTSLQDALSNAVDSDFIWIAGGTYKPSASARSEYFDIVVPNLKIYGGFAGIETQLSDRVLGGNETILSGDLLENDVNVADFISNYGNTSRNVDNSYTIINISATGNNLILDGLTISDAHNNNGATAQGGAIIKEKTVSQLTFRNCSIKDNVSRNDNAGLLAEFELNNIPATKGELSIENCKFINNMSRWATGIYTQIKSNSNLDITITNSLFDGNISGNLNTTSATGISGSAGWFRMLGNNSNVNLDFSNNTLVNNIDNGTGQSMTASKHAVLGISRSSGFVGVFNVEAANNIFWDNKTAGNVATRSITDLYKSPVNSVNVYNSIDEQSFNDSSITSTTNISNQDPLFSNASAQDYTLTGNSPAVDNGDNNFVLSTDDLNGNQRIFNTTVDIGAYEYSSTLSAGDFELSKSEIKLYPNPATTVLNIKMKSNLKRATIYSVLGVKILETTSKTITTSNLKSGLYLITIETENGSVATKRFIKQ